MSRKPPISDGLRLLVKKLAQYTIDQFNAGVIGVKRTKHTVGHGDRL